MFPMNGMYPPHRPEIYEIDEDGNRHRLPCFVQINRQENGPQNPPSNFQIPPGFPFLYGPIINPLAFLFQGYPQPAPQMAHHVAEEDIESVAESQIDDEVQSQAGEESQMEAIDLSQNASFSTHSSLPNGQLGTENPHSIHNQTQTNSSACDKKQDCVWSAGPSSSASSFPLVSTSSGDSDSSSEFGAIDCSSTTKSFSYTKFSHDSTQNVPEHNTREQDKCSLGKTDNLRTCSETHQLSVNGTFFRKTDNNTFGSQSQTESSPCDEKLVNVLSAGPSSSASSFPSTSTTSGDGCSSSEFRTMDCKSMDKSFSYTKSHDLPQSDPKHNTREPGACSLGNATDNLGTTSELHHMPVNHILFSNGENNTFDSQNQTNSSPCEEIQVSVLSDGPSASSFPSTSAIFGEGGSSSEFKVVDCRSKDKSFSYTKCSLGNAADNLGTSSELHQMSLNGTLFSKGDSNAFNSQSQTNSFSCDEKQANVLSAGPSSSASSFLSASGDGGSSSEFGTMDCSSMVESFSCIKFSCDLTQGVPESNVSAQDECSLGSTTDNLRSCSGIHLKSVNGTLFSNGDNNTFEPSSPIQEFDVGNPQPNLLMETGVSNSENMGTIQESSVLERRNSLELLCNDFRQQGNPQGSGSSVEAVMVSSSSQETYQENIPENHRNINEPENMPEIFNGAIDEANGVETEETDQENIPENHRNINEVENMPEIFNGGIDEANGVETEERDQENIPENHININEVENMPEIFNGAIDEANGAENEGEDENGSLMRIRHRRNPNAGIPWYARNLTKFVAANFENIVLPIDNELRRGVRRSLRISNRNKFGVHYYK